MAPASAAGALADVIQRIHRGGRYVDPDLAMTALMTEDSPLTDRGLHPCAAVASSRRPTD